MPSTLPPSGRLNRNAIRPPSRLGLSEPQPAAIQPAQPIILAIFAPRRQQTCAAVSMQRPGFLNAALTTKLHQHDACMSRPDTSVLPAPHADAAGAARTHGTAVTPSHSPEIVGQIFRDLSATAAYQRLPASSRGVDRRRPRRRPRLNPAQPQPACFSPPPSLLVTDHSRGWFSIVGTCQ